MTVSSDFVAYVTDQLAQSMRVVSRRMFGGMGLYCEELFFGLIADDVLYLKVDDSNRADYAARGCTAFQPTRGSEKYSMNYFAVPPEVLEDADEFAVWARKSLAVAAAKAAKSGVGRTEKSPSKPSKTTRTPRRSSR